LGDEKIPLLLSEIEPLSFTCPALSLVTTPAELSPLQNGRMHSKTLKSGLVFGSMYGIMVQSWLLCKLVCVFVSSYFK